MADTQDSFTGNGTLTDYSFTFPYLKQSEVKASLDGTATTNFRFLTATKIQFVNNTTANTPTAPASGVKIKIFRETDSATLAATFYAGSAIKSEDLNDNFTQNLYATQEVTERYLSNLGGTMVGDLNLGEDVILKFEGATDNAHETILTVVDPTADRTITLPNVTGTVITTGDTGTIATGMIAADAINGTKLADDSVDSEHYVDGSIDTAHIADAQITTVKILDANVTTAKILDANVTTAKIADSNVTTAKIAADAVNGTKIADDSINSEHYVDGSIDTAHIADSQITSAKIADATIVAADLASNAVTTAKITDANVTTAKIADSNVTTAKLVDNAITTAKVTDANITTAKLAANSVTTAKITDANVTTAKIADANVTTAKIADDNVTTAKIPDNAITTAKIADAELTTLAGMPSGTASVLADSTALTSTTAELNILDNKTFRASGDGTLTTTSDTEMPSSKVIATHVASSITAVGGFKSIADEVSFPATASMPATGVAVSINNAAGVVVNGSGVSTTGRTTDGTPATVTINGFPSSLYGETLAAGVGLIVQASSTANTYTYHKLLAAETDVKQLSDDINDFNARYRVAGSAPGSNNDAGDMYFDTSANKMKVYNGTTSAWDDVASVGDFFINTLSSSSGTGGGSATFNNNAYRFTLSSAPTSAQQLIVSVNGVIQKPNAGSSQPSEGFAINGNDIIFSAAPASGSDYFIVTQGSSVSIGTPSDNTVSTAKIQNLAVTNAKIANDTIAEVKLDVHNAPATGKFLRYTSNGMEWDDVPAGVGGANGVDFNDDVKARFGTGNDLEIEHDGSQSYIQNVGTGNLYITNDNGGTINLQTNGSENAVKCIENGSVEIYYDGSKKLETQSTGVKFTGELRGNDDERIKLGNSQDFQLYHHPSHDSYIVNDTGFLAIKSTEDIRLQSTSNEFMVKAIVDGAVELYHNNSKKLETTSSGINVTGQINVNGSALSAAPEITATVDGSLSADDAVIVKSTGNIEKVTKTISLANPITHSSIRQVQTNRYDHKLAYDKLTGYVACVARNGNLSNRLQLTFHKLASSTYRPESEEGGNIYTVNSSNSYYPQIASNKKGQFLIVYKDTGDNRIVCAAWSVNSSGVGSQGQAKYVSTSGQSTSYSDVIYSPDDDLFVIVYREGSVTKSRTLTMDSNNNTTLNTVSSDLFSYYLSVPNKYLYYDEYTKKIIHAGWNGSYIRAISGTISGTNLSWNSAVNIAGNGSYQGEYFTLGGDPKTGLMFACWMGASSQSDYGKAIGFKVNGNGFTAGSETTHRSSATGAHGVGYNGATEQIVMSYGGNSSWSTRTVSINSSSLALTFGTAEEIAAHSPQYSSQSVVYMEDQQRMMISSPAPSNQNYQTNLVSAFYGSSTTNMTTTNFIGFASSAYSNGNTGTVKVTGNTSTHSSLTAGQKYYVQINGALSTTADSPSVEAGIALSSTKLLIKG